MNAEQSCSKAALTKLVLVVGPRDAPEQEECRPLLQSDPELICHWCQQHNVHIESRGAYGGRFARFASESVFKHERNEALMKIGVHHTSKEHTTILEKESLLIEKFWGNKPPVMPFNIKTIEGTEFPKFTFSICFVRGCEFLDNALMELNFSECAATWSKLVTHLVTRFGPMSKLVESAIQVALVCTKCNMQMLTPYVRDLLDTPTTLRNIGIVLRTREPRKQEPQSELDRHAEYAKKAKCPYCGNKKAWLV